MNMISGTYYDFQPYFFSLLIITSSFHQGPIKAYHWYLGTHRLVYAQYFDDLHI